jgi:hypothetical protein
MTSTPESPDVSTSDEPTAPEAVTVDDRLLAAHDLARAALAEITPASTIGDPVDYVIEADGVVSLRFANRLAGYPGWLWTVSVAAVDGAEPTVLEVELLPAAGALLAPDWVPWAVRLADYQAAQAAADEDESESDDLDDDDTAELDDADDIDDEDDDEVDEDDFADGSTAVTHAGDVDGVDIDALDDAAVDDDDLPDADSDGEDAEDEDSDDESDHDESLWER